ncbi:MAG: YdaU family protein [Thauera propionica]|jgi:uncharacterized protein YdaU (DUF1376 family)|nr:YdaU family protein [Thauera propionica]
MNYYEHHLGDYAKDTGHLSMLEHGAYRILLDRYYSTEAGIPAAQAYRLARARSEEERQAVDVVLEEFFELVDGVWINGRAEEEIAAAQARIEASRQNGKKGGRPRKNPEVSDSETQQKPSGFSPGSDSETQQKAHQAPGTKHQAPVNPLPSQAAAITEPEVAREDVDVAASDQTHGRACEIVSLLRQRGAALTASDPRVTGWALSGVSDAQLLTALERANERRQARASPAPINAGYLDAILTDIRNPGANHGKPHRRTAADQRADTIAELTGRKRRDPDDAATRTLPGEARVVG